MEGWLLVEALLFESGWWIRLFAASTVLLRQGDARVGILE